MNYYLFEDISLFYKTVINQHRELLSYKDLKPVLDHDPETNWDNSKENDTCLKQQKEIQIRLPFF